MGNAAFAAAIASRISSRVDSGTIATTSFRLAGLRRSIVLLEHESTHWPFTKLRHVCVVAAAVAIAGSFQLQANSIGYRVCLDGAPAAPETIPENLTDTENGECSEQKGQVRSAESDRRRLGGEAFAVTASSLWPFALS
jgi:hypothetical protein